MKMKILLMVIVFLITLSIPAWVWLEKYKELNLNGVCVREGKVLSDEEKVRNFINYAFFITERFRPNYSIQYNGVSFPGIKIDGVAYERVLYKNVDDFIKQNPDCCQLVSALDYTEFASDEYPVGGHSRPTLELGANMKELKFIYKSHYNKNNGVHIYDGLIARGEYIYKDLSILDSKSKSNIYIYSISNCGEIIPIWNVPDEGYNSYLNKIFVLVFINNYFLESKNKFVISLRDFLYGRY